MKKMHLIGMKVSNFLKVTSFNYQFDGKSVKLSGKNGAGKTSVLQAIWAVAGGFISDEEIVAHYPLDALLNAGER